MTAVDPRVAWLIFGGFVAVSLGLTVAGGVLLIGAFRTLKKRIDLYKDLPLLRGVASTQARIAAAQARFDELDTLLERARNAVESMRSSFASLSASFGAVGATYARAGFEFRMLRGTFAPRSKATQSPES